MTKLPAWVEAARGQWAFRGQTRPAFAHQPKPGQESVWDFPRPPALRHHDGELRVCLNRVEIAATTNGRLVCETAHPPTYYIPLADVDPDALRPVEGSSFCEWKGASTVFDVVGPPDLLRAAWAYRSPFPEFADLADCVAFMPSDLECFVDGERVRPQPGGFYGGWITSRFSGPFKGEPGISG